MSDLDLQYKNLEIFQPTWLSQERIWYEKLEYFVWTATAKSAKYTLLAFKYKSDAVEERKLTNPNQRQSILSRHDIEQELSHDNPISPSHPAFHLLAAAR